MEVQIERALEALRGQMCGYVVQKPMGRQNSVLTACSLPRQRTRRIRAADWWDVGIVLPIDCWHGRIVDRSALLRHLV